MTTVVALGGNALMRPGERGTAAEQLANLKRAVVALQPLLEPGLVLTHGNGPQVGNELLRQERAADEAPPLPLWLAVAQTQAEIGALIAAELRPAAGSRDVSCVSPSTWNGDAARTTFAPVVWSWIEFRTALMPSWVALSILLTTQTSAMRRFVSPGW